MPRADRHVLLPVRCPLEPVEPDEELGEHGLHVERAGDVAVAGVERADEEAMTRGLSLAKAALRVAAYRMTSKKSSISYQRSSTTVSATRRVSAPRT